MKSQWNKFFNGKYFSTVSRLLNYNIFMYNSPKFWRAYLCIIHSFCRILNYCIIVTFGKSESIKFNFKSDQTINHRRQIPK